VNCASTRLSLGHRVLSMFLTWLFLGAVIGVIGGLGRGGLQIVCMMIAGMVVLPIPGVLLGLIGGDAMGSVTGAAGGLLSCGIVGCFGEVPIPSQAMNSVVVFGALVGATGFLFVRLMLWKYGMMFRMLCWAIGVTSASDKTLALSGHALIPNCLISNSVHSAAVRARSRQHRLLSRRLR
jgi:hypothetical protein